MKQIDWKGIWERHKKKILIGVGGSVLGGVIIYDIVKKKDQIKELINLDFNFKEGILAERDGISIPNMTNMECLDITKDGIDGRVVWMRDCTLSQMGLFGENLSKIDGVDLNTFATMIVLNKMNINE